MQNGLTLILLIIVFWVCAGFTVHAENCDVNKYLEHFSQAIQMQWNEDIQFEDTQRVQFDLQKDGSIANIKIKNSGASEKDAVIEQALIQLIKMANPLTPLPDCLGRNNLSVYFEFRMSPDDQSLTVHHGVIPQLSLKPVRKSSPPPVPKPLALPNLKTALDEGPIVKTTDVIPAKEQKRIPLSPSLPIPSSFEELRKQHSQSADECTIAVEKSYTHNVKVKLQAHWLPPSIEENAHVELRFNILKDGTVSHLQVMNVSATTKNPQQKKTLQEAAVDTVRRSSPFKHLPSCFSKTHLTIKHSLYDSLKSTPPAEVSASRCSEQQYGQYMKDIQTRIKEKWTPPASRQDETVVVRFTLMKDGTISDSRITKMSADEVANTAALKALQVAAPFEKLPDCHNENSVTIEFTFDYNVINSAASEPSIRKVPKAKPRNDRLVKIVTSEKHIQPWLIPTRNAIKEDWDYLLPKTIKPVVFQCAVNRDGSISNLKKIKSSGEKKKDKAAERIIKEATPFKPLPDEVEVDSVLIEIRMF